MEKLPLRWRDGCSVVVSPDDREVWLFAVSGPVRLAGIGAGALARAIDGRRNWGEVLSAAQSVGMEEGRAAQLLNKWQASGHITVEPLVTRAAIRARLVGAPETLASALTAAGVEVVDPGRSGDADVAIVVLDELLAAADIPTSVGEKFIAVQLRGVRALVSPVLGPGLGCARCLTSRMSVRRGADLVAARRAGLTWPPASPIVREEAASLAAGVVVSMLRSDSHSSDYIHVIDLDTGEISRHRIVPIPGCPACDPDGESLIAAHMGERPISEVDTAVDGAGLVGSRILDPDETYLTHSHHVSDVVGIVPVVEPVGSWSFRVYAAGANLVGVDDPHVAASILRNRGGGKGLTMAAARAGALAESLERDALRWRGDETVVKEKFSDLALAIHPNSVQLFSDAQMALAEMAWLTPRSALTSNHPVPYRFDSDVEVSWSPIRSLVTDQVHWLPSSMMFIGSGAAPGQPPACSNGAAAGNTYAEAILQGLLELVERDAVALWWYPRSRRRFFDLEGWGDPRVLAAAAPHLAAGSELRVLDLTTDIGIPAAVAITRGGGLPLPLLGAGAHPDPAIAVARAITEAAQMRASLDEFDAHDPRARKWLDDSWWSRISDSDTSWFWGTESALVPESPHFESVTQARDDVVAKIRARGHDVLWADLSRRDHGLTVVRTYAPGLRHFWRRLAPGRLYDVPLKQGWIDTPLTEETVNPLEMPL